MSNSFSHFFSWHADAETAGSHFFNWESAIEAAPGVSPSQKPGTTEESLKEIAEGLLLIEEGNHGKKLTDPHFLRNLKRAFSRTPSLRKYFTQKCQSSALPQAVKNMILHTEEVAPEVMAKSFHRESEKAAAQQRKDFIASGPYLFGEELKLLKHVLEFPIFGWSKHCEMTGIAPKKGAELRKLLEHEGLIDFKSKRQPRGGRPLEIAHLTQTGELLLKAHLDSEKEPR